MLMGVTEKEEDVTSEITWIFGTFIQNCSRNTFYLGYTTVTRTLRLFTDVLNCLKCKYYSISLTHLVLLVGTLSQLVWEAELWDAVIPAALHLASRPLVYWNAIIMSWNKCLQCRCCGILDYSTEFVSKSCTFASRQHLVQTFKVIFAHFQIHCL